MPNTPGNIEVIARELGKAFEPLKDLVGGDILSLLGLGLPEAFKSKTAIVNGITQGQTVAKDLTQEVQTLVTAIDAGSQGDMISAGASLIKTVIDLINALVQLGESISSEANSFAFTPAEKAELQTFGEEFGIRLVSYLLVGYLEKNAPTLANSLMVLGLLDNKDVDSDPGSNIQVPYRKRRVYFDRIPKLFTDPGTHFTNVYKWGLGPGDFKGEEIFTAVKLLMDNLDFPANLYQIGGKYALEAYIFHLEIDDAQNPPGLKLEVRIPATLEYTKDFEFTPPWKASLTTKGTFSAGLESSVFPSGDLVVNPPDASLEFETQLDFRAEYDDRKLIFIGTPEGSRLEAQSLGGGAGAVLRVNPIQGEAFSEPTISVFIKEGKLVLDFSDGDGFLQNLLSSINVAAGFDLTGTWKPSTGLELTGSASIELLLPAHIDLGVAEINSIYIIGKIGNDPPIEIELSTQLTANLGPIKAAIERMGVKVPITFPDDGKGNLGPMNLGFEFKPPNGVGLSLDAGVIKGGGYLFFDFDRGEYAGAIELTFSGFLSLKAIGLITTKMPDGSDGFSLLIIITAEFTLQLGFGFVFLGAGGLLGVNRTMKLEALAEGVRTGATANIMFPTNIIENAPRIISDLRTFFPVEEGKFLIGPMVKLGWGTPTLISIALGIIIEIRTTNGGGVERIAIVGVLKCILPDEAAAILVLQINFIGAIDFEKKTAFFFASIFESRVLFITIEGEMGVLVAWGEDANFLVSVGGFHPRFEPPPLPFPVPKRVAISILNESWGKIRVEGYFAVTSNTVQFGVKAELMFGFSELKIEGHFAFDALFQFDPFFFIIEISGGVSLKVFGIGLFSISLKFSLEGPTPWRATGYGKLKILFFSIKAKFDETWGEKRDTKLDPIEVMPLIEGELKKPQNWQALLPASANNLLVSLRKLEGAADDDESLVLHPVGTLRVSQRVIPLEFKMDKVGNQRPTDANTFELTVQAGPLSKKADFNESFARAQFQDLDDSKKLSSPAYEKEIGGLELSATGKQVRSGRMTVRHVRYELSTIDTAYKRVRRRFFSWLQVLFGHFTKNNAAARSEVSYRRKNELQPFADKIEVINGGYTVAFNMNNKAMNQEAHNFTSQAKADAFMATQLAQNPGLSGSLHVIPTHEVNTAA